MTEEVDLNEYIAFRKEYLENREPKPGDLDDEKITVELYTSEIIFLTNGAGQYMEYLKFKEDLGVTKLDEDDFKAAMGTIAMLLQLLPDVPDDNRPDS